LSDSARSVFAFDMTDYLRLDFLSAP
jgi:hypothetical protein